MEQAEFNAKLRDLPTTEAELAEFLRDRSLDIMSELDELLRTTSWKKHRRETGRLPNRQHRLEECIDIYKLWLTTVQGLHFTQQELEDGFWRKSMVVRQRHSEEFLKQLDRPACVIDIDGVLCDYSGGFCTWIANRAPLFAKQAMAVYQSKDWIGRAEQFGMTETEWQGFKHEFRAGGHKRFMPLMPGAKEFLERCRDAGYLVILLTSRCIDQYPNIYSDTVSWLSDNQLPYDWLWWSLDKGERLIKEKALKWVKFVVDDDPRYVAQFLRVGLKVWWMQTVDHHQVLNVAPGQDHVQVVHSLDEIQIAQTTQGV